LSGSSRTSPWSRLIAPADNLFRYCQLSRRGRGLTLSTTSASSRQPSGFPERITSLLSQLSMENQPAPAATSGNHTRPGPLALEQFDHFLSGTPTKALAGQRGLRP
jgi:hypothetical protein